MPPGAGAARLLLLAAGVAGQSLPPASSDAGQCAGEENNGLWIVVSRRCAAGGRGLTVLPSSCSRCVQGSELKWSTP